MEQNMTNKKNSFHNLDFTGVNFFQLIVYIQILYTSGNHCLMKGPTVFHPVKSFIWCNLFYRWESVILFCDMQNRVLVKYKLHHVFFWMLVFGFWYFLRYEDYKVPGRAFTVTLIKVIDLALMIYITNYVLIPRLFYRKKIWVVCTCLYSPGSYQQCNKNEYPWQSYGYSCYCIVCRRPEKKEFMTMSFRIFSW